jgi:hypothetical protein
MKIGEKIQVGRERVGEERFPAFPVFGEGTGWSSLETIFIKIMRAE